MLRSAARLRGSGGFVARCCSGSNRPFAATRRLQPLAQRRSLCALANHSDCSRGSDRDRKGGTINAIPRYNRRLSNMALLHSANSSKVGGGGGGGGGGGVILGGFGRVEAENQLASAAASRRQLSTRRGLPPRRTLPEKIFAGAVVVVLAAWGLLFGAITLVLLPFVGIGLFLLRRNFQRGGISRELVAKMARKMAERRSQYPTGGGGGGGFGGVSGGGSGGGGGSDPMGQWMHRAPTQGVMSSLLARMLGGGIRGMKLVSVLRSEVKRRALRNPGLASALGGDIGSFSDVEMSTVGTSGGSFGPGDGGGKTGGPSRVIKARFRFVGQRGGAGWAEVNVSDWEDAGGEDGTGGMEYDRVFVTLDSGKTFDLTNDVEGGGGKATFSRREGRPAAAGKAMRRGSPKEGGGRPVEAEFRDK